MRSIKITLFVLTLISLIFSQSPDKSVVSKNEELSPALLGEDTVIYLDNPKTDTVYTMDDQVMDVKPGKIALSEMYYPVDDSVVVIDRYGKQISYESLPIKATVRVRFVKNDDGEFVIKRIRILKSP